jgi:putative ferrous iron transport protein C
MILSDLRDYLRQRGQASLQDMALHFDADPDALRGMLEQWIRKGKVSRRSAKASCGDSCTQCDPASVEIYVWGTEASGTETVIPVQNIGCSRS